MTSHAPKDKFDNKCVQWINDRLPIFSMMQNEYGKFPTPINFNYFWNFGAIAMAMLGIMIVTGIFLAMNYVPNGSMAFESVERMSRDVNYGWLLRYAHMNGASFFFIAVYIHIFRGLFYGSYKKPRELVWIFGVVMMLLMMATAFMGYALPWSQMSGWGTTVITSLFGAIPLVGDGLVTWLWGGFTVGNPTLNRFYALHFLLPFVILGVVFVHVWALHVSGSNNPTGVEPKSEKDTVPFHPYYTTKDSFGTVVFLIFYFGLVFFAPLLLAEPDHFRQFDPMQTPPHIVPEWYFLPFYAILRSFTLDIYIPFTHIIILSAKLQGVIAMFGSILLLFFLPWLDSSPVRSARYRCIYKWCLMLLVVAFAALTYAGGQLPQGWPVVIGRICTFYYFLHFLVIVPVLGTWKLSKPSNEPNGVFEVFFFSRVARLFCWAFYWFVRCLQWVFANPSVCGDLVKTLRKLDTSLPVPNSISEDVAACMAACKKVLIPAALALTFALSTQALAADKPAAAASSVQAAAAQPAAAPASAAVQAPATDEEALLTWSWPEDGVFGSYDKAALQRGFQVYKEVCSACHAMKFVYYRNLEDLGYSPEQVKSLAATYTISDGPGDDGNMFDRPGKPSDHFKSPYPNDQAARATNGGALPPDMSLLVKAREGGEDYIYAVLTGFGAAPADVTMMPGLNYNKAFAGRQIAMPPPLTDGRVTFADGSPNDVASEARDVTQFLAWASEPHMEQRKQMGLKVILFMLAFAGIMLNAKRKVWSKLH